MSDQIILRDFWYLLFDMQCEVLHKTVAGAPSQQAVGICAALRHRHVYDAWFRISVYMPHESAAGCDFWQQRVLIGKHGCCSIS